MKLFFRIACLVLLLSGTQAQDDLGFDLSDALGPDPTPAPTPKPPPKDDFNIEDAVPGYKPDDSGKGKQPVNDGRQFRGGHEDPYNTHTNSGGDQAQEAGSGKVAGIVSAIGVALVGAASSYFAYQKKKLCFKLQGGQDPESGNRHMTQSEPQVMSNLLQS